MGTVVVLIDHVMSLVEKSYGSTLCWILEMTYDTRRGAHERYRNQECF